MLHLRDISVYFGQNCVVDEVELTVAEHEIVSVLGPSGSGKSTLLRVVAGLERPQSGQVVIAGQDVTTVSPHRRGVGLMFQDHALFPQRDVAGNIAFGLQMHRFGADEVTARVEELLDLVGLAGAGDRPVTTLSGGEQQRVALARALAPRPKVLLLDEPLGQLDRTLRERLVVDLRRLFVALGSTVLAVTHDQAEAFALADRVVVMEAGRIAQVGPPREVWERPVSPFVAHFLGFHNVVTAVVKSGIAGTPWGEVPVSAVDGEHSVLIRPSGVVLDPHGLLAGTVVARTFRGDHVLLLISPESGPELEAACRLTDAPDPGTSVRIRFDPAEVVVLAG